ncbi:GNAT family N-acetyltransferase [Coralliovum pocilloporae]|uniref:GNAT family N-acetyltransferase n=1 Tax=Coralliovum pocilloporae TaxID=3066369 RepID=UPI0033077803
MRFIWKQFEDFTTAELYATLKLRFDVFILEQRCFYPELDDADQNARHLLLLEGDSMPPLAYLRVRDALDGLWIGRVVVHPDARGEKLGQKLMQKALDDLTGTNPGRPILLQAQAHLAGFYGGLGFKAISEVYDEDGIPHVDMRLESMPG